MKLATGFDIGFGLLVGGLAVGLSSTLAVRAIAVVAGAYIVVTAGERGEPQ